MALLVQRIVYFVYSILLSIKFELVEKVFHAPFLPPIWFWRDKPMVMIINATLKNPLWLYFSLGGQ